MAIASLSGGSFSVTDGKLTCGGSYDSMSLEPTITMQTSCSDGRKGIVVATRDSTGTSGHGTVTLNDGMEGKFIFGPAAANF
jgi:phage-related tail fiber protein